MKRLSTIRPSLILALCMGLAACAGGGGAASLFSVAISTQSVSISRGGAADVLVTVAGHGAFNESVAFTLSNAPSGVTASFSPQQVVPGESSVLTLSASTDATPGAYPINVVGIAGGGQRTAGLLLTVGDDAPPAPPAPEDVNLHVTVVGSGGKVSSSPGGIDCGMGASACSSGFSADTFVVLTAEASQGWRLSAWGGDCGASGGASTCGLTMDAARSVTATFAQDTQGPPGTELDMSGTWRGTTMTPLWGTESAALDLVQNGSHLSGTLVIDPHDLGLTSAVSGTVSGNEATIHASFALNQGARVDYRFDGPVAGEAYSGTLTLSFSPGGHQKGTFTLSRVGAPPTEPPGPLDVEALLLARPAWFAGDASFAWAYIFGVNHLGERFGIFHTFVNKREQFHKPFIWDVDGDVIDILFADGLTHTRAKVLAHDAQQDTLSVDVGFTEIWHGCDSPAIPAPIPNLFVVGVCSLLP